jgi:hypothetical protein
MFSVHPEPARRHMITADGSVGRFGTLPLDYVRGAGTPPRLFGVQRFWTLPGFTSVPLATSGPGISFSLVSSPTDITISAPGGYRFISATRLVTTVWLSSGPLETGTVLAVLLS